MYNEYLNLIEQAKYHSKKYYDEDAPEITDFEYDQLTQRIKEIEAQHPEWIVSDSPTQHVGGTVSMAGANKVQHEVQLASLNDIFRLEDVEKWYAGIGKPVVAVQPKCDGLSMAIEYRNGQLYKAATRGDGFVGEDVTENAKRVSGLPLELPIRGMRGRLIVRAEVYMPVPAFEKLNAQMEAEGKKLYANPRNAAAGSLRVKDPRVTGKRGLAAVCFAILHSDMSLPWGIGPLPGHSETDDLVLLENLGFNVIPSARCSNMEEIKQTIDWIDTWQRKNLLFWIDGAVIKTDRKDLQKEIGATAKYPKHAAAYKYPQEAVPTKILDITVQTGRTGVLTPVAELEPIQLCGTTVR